MLHEQQSQYLLQIAKCLDESCCESFELSYLSIIRNRLLLSTIALIRNGPDFKWVKRSKNSQYFSFSQNNAMTAKMNSTFLKIYPLTSFLN